MPRIKKRRKLRHKRPDQKVIVLVGDETQGMGIRATMTLEQLIAALKKKEREIL
jgi:hypothetical protein